MKAPSINWRHSTGAYVVEFALVVTIFLTILLAIMDFGRLFFQLNSAAEATRFGARTAVVCKLNSSAVIEKMRIFASLPLSTDISVDWYDATGTINSSCRSSVSDTCAGVSVRIQNIAFTPISPITWIGFNSVSVPGFQTYMTREMLGLDPENLLANCAY
jgi:hypothetical protein